MRQALDLARSAAGLTSPNPRVGAVVVREGKVIGSGTHTYAGLDHAEILALREAGTDARGATLFVTLEPCSHQGRTPACAPAVIAAGIVRVVAPMVDPNPRVAGAGFELLRRAGVRVDTGVAADEAKDLNLDFTRWIRTGRPFVTLKAALSLDGGVASAPGRRTAIGGAASLQRVQALRHENDALLTGAGTVTIDDPELTDRSGRPRRRRLLRVVLDPEGRVPSSSRLRRQAAEADADDLWICRERDLEAVFAELGRREILSVLVEAGPRLTTSLLSGGWVDCLRLFYSPRLLGSEALRLVARQCGPWQVGMAKVTSWGDDVELAWLLHDPYA